MTDNHTTINPYFAFDGNCEEAMNFYHQILGGEMELMTFEKGPMEVPPSHLGKIMHALIRLEGGAQIMASDTMPGQEAIPGSNVSISINEPNPEKAKKIFAGLSESGAIVMPLEMTFWKALFGMCIDRYGHSWMVNCQLAEE